MGIVWLFIVETESERERGRERENREKDAFRCVRYLHVGVRLPAVDNSVSIEVSQIALDHRKSRAHEWESAVSARSQILIELTVTICLKEFSGLQSKSV